MSQAMTADEILAALDRWNVEVAQVRRGTTFLAQPSPAPVHRSVR